MLNYPINCGKFPIDTEKTNSLTTISLSIVLIWNIGTVQEEKVVEGRKSIFQGKGLEFILHTKCVNKGMIQS